MKLYQLVLIVLTAGLVSCQKEKSLTILTGKITGEVPVLMEYSVPLNGISFFGFEDSVPLDSLGNFYIELDIGKPCFIELSTGYKAYGTVIAEPGMSYTVFIDTEAKENAFRIESENKEGQELYNQIANRSMMSGDFDMEARIYLKDSIATEIKQDILKSEEIEITGFRRLLGNKIISGDFYNLVRMDREYFYRGVQAIVAFVNYGYSETGRNKLDEDEYTEMWKEVFQTKSVSDSELMRSQWFFYYVQTYLRYKELIEEPLDTNKLKEVDREGLIHTHNIQRAKHYLSDPQLEYYYYAAYIYYEAVNKNYEEELIALFEGFKTTYPSSEFTRFIEPEIIPIVLFHKKLSEPLDENVKFIDDFGIIDSLKDLAKEVGGERIYVDVWATWCGPCKKEFKHNMELYDLLRSKNVTPLYLSVDREDRKEQWRDMIKYYGLKGYHMRANEKLVADLIGIQGNSPFTIPWYILVDGHGNIIKKFMDPPSQIKNLEKQLSED